MFVTHISPSTSKGLSAGNARYTLDGVGLEGSINGQIPTNPHTLRPFTLYTQQIVAPWGMKQTLVPALAPRVTGITLCTYRSAEVRSHCQRLVEAMGVCGSYLLIDCAELLQSNNSLRQ